MASTRSGSPLLGLAQGLAVDVEEGHAVAFGEEALGTGEADAAGASGDDRHGRIVGGGSGHGKTRLGERGENTILHAFER
jgi:hypothetical protein